MKKIFCLWMLILGCQLHAQTQQQLVFGATTNLPGATLVFETASNYVTASSYCFPTVSGAFFDYNIYDDPDTYSYPYLGYYYNCLQVFNALPATEDNGGPADGAAAPGTVIQMQLLSVEGPAGASFAFWEGNSDGVTFGTNVTWSVPVPSSNNTNLIPVTQAANTPDNDPYGQIQNRVFGFTQPGLYKLTWQLVDTSTNGPGGTPLDLPSAPFSLYYQADCTISGITRQADGIHLKFAAPSGFLLTDGYYYMEYNILKSAGLGTNASWSTVLDLQGHPVIILGDDYLHTNIVAPAGTTQFYRLLGTPPPVFP